MDRRSEDFFQNRIHVGSKFMEINYLAVLVCGVMAMVVGMAGYGPMLFGKTWMKVMGVDMNTMTPDKVKEAQKKMAPVYALNFLTVLLTMWVLAGYVEGWNTVSGVTNALWVWLGFVMPTVAGQAMWSGKSKELSWKMFFISSGYQLVTLVIAGWILGMWK